ncbi:1323_t:CDS:2, partial [Dentiscutata heterogama]
ESPANVAMASRNQQKEVKEHTNYEQRAKTYGSKKVQNANTNNEANITTSPRNQQREVKVHMNYEQRAKIVRKNQQKEVKIYMNYKQRAKTIVLAATHQGTTETTRQHQKLATPTKNGTRNRCHQQMTTPEREEY